MTKLLKYEFMRSFIPFAIISGIFAVSMILLASVLKAKTLESDLELLALLMFVGIFGTIISVLGLFVVQVMFVINTFSKGLFGTYGTLLFCLPLSIDSILLAKILNCFILLGGSSLFYCFIGVQILTLYEPSFDFYGRLWQLLKHLTPSDITDIIIYGFLLLSYIVQFLTQILLALALLNSIHIQNYRFVIGLLFFISLSFVTSLIGTFMPNLFYKPVALIIESLIAGTIFYFSARYLIIRKLELL